MTSRTLDYIPDNLPPRAVTSAGVAWPPHDSDTAPWDTAHITITGGETLFAEHTLDGVPYLEMTPQRAMNWSEVDAIVDTHFENGWRCVVFLSLDDDGLRSVLVPWAHFLPQPHDEDDPAQRSLAQPDPFLIALARQVKDVATGRYLEEDEHVETFPGNLDYLISFAPTSSN